MAAPPLVLASSSPQRRAILEQLGVPFEVAAPRVEEETAGDVRDLVVENALRKARAVASTPAGAGRRVLGVDTAVSLHGRVYGKPRGEGETRAFLERLAGREHEVLSGVALLVPPGFDPEGADSRDDPGAPDRGGRPDASALPGHAERAAVALTRVRFREFGAAEIAWYLASGEWRERAGGYAIQGRGAALVERIEGEHWNVVGLPVYELARLAPDLFRA
ncbi:MAG TPA: Maf family protein [Thermoleophilaceae bacterium]|nr:Maf family protein [Thermoleophilaceae bacterium]